MNRAVTKSFLQANSWHSPFKIDLWNNRRKRIYSLGGAGMKRKPNRKEW